LEEPTVRSPSIIVALLGGVVASFCLTAQAVAQPKVVTTIKPVHALALQIMRGVAEPTLLVKRSFSPHAYSLTPADATALSHANVFIRVSPAIEPFTEKVVRALPGDVEVITLIDTPGLKLLATRRGPTFSGAATLVNADDAGNIDGHAWLDPANAQVMVERITQLLSRRDPANAATFRSNADALKGKLDDLAAELDGLLRPVAARPYVLFHDAMQYFERRFRLNPVGSISISPDIPPSGKRLVELRQRMRAAGVVCVFAEPPFSTELVATVVEGTGAHVGTLDPEAIRLAPAPDLYFSLMRALAADLTRCLSTPI
jgi:zinc transport system substrate-binding protein